MISGSLKLIGCLLLSLYVSGCATITPLETHFENNFTDFNASKISVVKTTPFKKSYQYSYDEVWSNTLYILTQYAIIPDLSKESGIITYIDIDGVFFTDVFTSDRFLYWEFPFTVLIEKGPDGTIVYVYPMTDLFAEKGSNKKWWKTVEAGFNQKAGEFIERLSIQLGTKDRWPWLTQKGE